MTVDGGGLKQVADAQGVEFINVGVHRAYGVALVDGQGNGFAGLAQHGGHIHIGGSDAGVDVGDHDDAVGQFDADFSLTAHEFQHITVGSGLDTAGIYQGEIPAAPLAFTVDPVTGNTGGILNDGGTVAGELIEEHGFADVGTTNDGNQRFCHGNTSFLQKQAY